MVTARQPACLVRNPSWALEMDLRSSRERRWNSRLAMWVTQWQWQGDALP
jgi:hypothetical protein